MGTEIPGSHPLTESGWALDELLRGNKRFLSNKCTSYLENEERRKATLTKQIPFAAILCCSDSQVAPEIIFDQSVGSIFVVRTAGNVLDDVALGSIEYAAQDLQIFLVMVLGHQRCGAVTATVQGKQVTGRIKRIVEKIEPAARKSKGMTGDPVANAVDANIRSVVCELRSCEPILAPMIKHGSIGIVGARYDLDTGKVVTIDT